MDKEKRLRSYLKQRFPGYDDSFESVAPLSDIVDSLGMFDLVEFLEQEFQISVPTEEFTPARFSSIANTLALVEELQST